MVAANLYKTYNRIIKTIIVIFAIFFLYNQLFVKENLSEIFKSLSTLIAKEKFLKYLIAVLLLMPLNWFLEALKWKKVLASQEYISIGTSIKAIFAGTTISSISVNRTGEFIGRVSVLKKHSFWEGTMVTIIGSYAQTFNTFLWGSLSACILLFSGDLDFGVNKYLLVLAFALLFISLLIFLFLYFKISWLKFLVKPSWKKTIRAISILKNVDNKTLITILLLSALRYLVFSTQFYILLQGVSVDINYLNGLMLISCMFLFNTIRPSIAMIEIGMRSFSALLIFKIYFIDILGQSAYPQNEVIMVTSFIWLINIVLPAIIGLFFIKDLKFFKQESKL